MHGFEGTGTRAIGIQQSLGVLATGGPPLTGAGGLSAIGLTDDQGIYLFVPLVAHAIGVTEAHLAIAVFSLALLSVIPIIYPLMIMKLFDSIVAALVLPVALVTRSGFMVHGDIYWVVGWSVLLLLPPVLLIYRRWAPSRLVLLVVIVTLASLASSIRNHAGLPVLLSAVLVVLYRQRSWTKRFASAALLLTVYLTVGGGVLGVARNYRDRTLGVDWSASAPTAHPFWHPVYLGLGYLPNRYGIRWDDSVAFLAVQRDDPTAGYLSPEYEASLRRQFLDIARADPGFVLSTYSAKGAALLSDAFHQFGPAWLFIPLASIAAAARKVPDILQYAMLALPALAINAVPPLLAIPDSAFEIGWLVGWGLAILLALGSVIAGTEKVTRAVLTHEVSLRSGTSVALRSSLKSKILVITVALTVMTFSVQSSLHDEADRRAYLEASAPFISGASVAGPRIRDWSFDVGLAPSWNRVGAVRLLPTPEGLMVRTTNGKFAYQLQSSDERLTPGHYKLVVAGKVLMGGLTLGVLDTARDAWIRTVNYWSGAIPGGDDLMGVDFNLTETMIVRIVVANWNLRSESSSWLLRDVTVIGPTTD